MKKPLRRVRSSRTSSEPNPELQRHGVTVPAQAAEKSSATQGRTLGKRSDPEFEQVTAYLRRDTKRAVKIALLHEGKGREFSELVQELLTRWLQSQ